MATIPVTCRYCESELVYKHVYARSGELRCRCRSCQRSFQVSYRYEGNKQGTPEKFGFIVPMVGRLTSGYSPRINI